MTDQSNFLGTFVWYDQMSNDLPGAEAFYTNVVGWTLAPNTMNEQRYTLLKAGESMVGGLMPIPEDAGKMGARPTWIGYIAVDDVAAYAEKVRAAGGVIHRDAAPIPNVGTFAVAADPHGAGFLLFKPNSTESPPPKDFRAPGQIGWHELHAGDGEKAFASVIGLFAAVGCTVGAGASYGAGYVYDHFGSYSLAFNASSLLCFIGFGILLLMKAPVRKAPQPMTVAACR